METLPEALLERIVSKTGVAWYVIDLTREPLFTRGSWYQIGAVSRQFRSLTKNPRFLCELMVRKFGWDRALHRLLERISNFERDTAIAVARLLLFEGPVQDRAWRASLSTKPPASSAGVTGSADVLVADVNWMFEGLTPIHRAISKSRCPLEIARLLVDAGADVDALTENDRFCDKTCLDIAWDPNRLKLVLDAGADVNFINDCGWTPLITCIWSSRDNIWKIKQLIDAGADLNFVVEDSGHSVLAYAVHLNSILTDFVSGYEIIECLVKAGANVDFRDDKGKPLILTAASHGIPEIVRVLLDGGADVNATDAEGRTALTVATQKGHDAVIRLLTPP